MDKSSAQSSIKKLNYEIFSLEPSSLVTLFEIDISDIGFDRNLISSSEIESEYNTVFRFHNNIKSVNDSSIVWNGKTYIAAPIAAEGFETVSQGTLPNPKLSITTSDEGVQHLAILKDRILQLGDIVGAKVTRIRTFAKFLDKENFFNSRPPQGFSPDPNAELPRDIFFIDRKSNESKNGLEYELSSILDIEGVKLPGRLVISNTCPFNYRGAGCMYEYNSRRNTEEHGLESESFLPQRAPAIATELDSSIPSLLTGIPILDKGRYDPNVVYNSGETVFVEKGNLKYYFVAYATGVSVSPPNANFWLADQCSKNVFGCSLRFGEGGSVQDNYFGSGVLPFGGFTAINRFK